MICFKKAPTLLLLALLSLSTQVKAASTPYEIDLKELDRGKAPPPAAAPKAEKKKVPKEKEKKHAAAAARKEKRQEHAAEDGYVRYTVKPGDHIFKILMVHFGMSNEAAERLIPEIIRVNHISNIKKLSVGQTLLIPVRAHKRGERGAEQERVRKQEEHAEESAKASRPERQRALPPMPPLPQAPPAPQLPAPAAPAVPAAPAPSAVPQAAAVPQAPAAQPLPETPTWVCSVTETDPATMVDSMLNALSIPWSRNKIVESGEGAATAFSIRVDRYFEYKGGRYIVNIGDGDPYTYTLLRLLEAAGYRVLMIGKEEDFKSVGEHLLKLIGVTAVFGGQSVAGGKEAGGFLVGPGDAGGKTVLITGQPVDRTQKWALAPGCGAR